MLSIEELKTKLSEYSPTLQELESQLSSPDLPKNPERYKQVNREYSKLNDIRSKLTTLVDLQTQISDSQELANSADAELAEFAQVEVAELTDKVTQLTQDLAELEEIGDPHDNSNCIIEIRAAAGGDESSLFAQELMRSYIKYAEKLGLSVEIADTSYSGSGGFKEVTFFVNGRDAYRAFKFESGVHRVQRVPVTEASGRIHTSTVSVVVLPEIPDLEVTINPEDLRIDVYRSSGPGGQSVNTTDSAVRVVHLPTGLIVTCQDQKSQLKNKEKALKILQAKLYDIAQQEANEKVGEIRQTAIQSGDRSAKIRTYNFPQSRVTDHRIKESWHNITEIMEGEFSDISKTLRERLASIRQSN